MPKRLLKNSRPGSSLLLFRNFDPSWKFVTSVFCQAFCSRIGAEPGFHQTNSQPERLNQVLCRMVDQSPAAWSCFLP